MYFSISTAGYISALRVETIINFIWPNSCLHYRQYKVFLEEASAQGNNLLLHNALRWLDKYWGLQLRY